jgi:hypothetical protein
MLYPCFFSIEGNMHIGFKASVAIRATTIFFRFFSCEKEKIEQNIFMPLFSQRERKHKKKVAQKSDVRESLIPPAGRNREKTYSALPLLDLAMARP